jgi:predicted aspartyl protease
MRHETRFVAGGLIIVETTIAGPRGTVPTRMLLDTGALMTTVTPEILDLVGYSPRDAIRPTRVHSAIGEEHGYELRLTAFTALGFTLHGVSVNVFDLGHDDIVDELIGMSFLNGINLEIRPAEGRILVEQVGGDDHEPRPG